MLDSEFARLAPEGQDALLGHFFTGDFFTGGLRGYDALHSVMTRPGPDRRQLSAGEDRADDAQGGRSRPAAPGAGHGDEGGAEARDTRLRRPGDVGDDGLHRGLAPGRRTGLEAVPVICYVAFLRHRHAKAAAAVVAATADAAAADLTAGSG